MSDLHRKCACGSGKKARWCCEKLPENDQLCLAHWTRPMTLWSIIHNGINSGDVPVTCLHSIDFPWFTAEFSRDDQYDWAKGSQEKSLLRLELRFPSGDERLVRWKEYARMLNIHQPWYDRITGPHVRKNERDWYVYRGPVPFEWVTGGYFTPKHERLTRDALVAGASAFAKLKLNAKLAPARRVTEAEAIALTHKERVATDSQSVKDAFVDHAVSQNKTAKSIQLAPSKTFLEWCQNCAQAYGEAFPDKVITE